MLVFLILSIGLLLVYTSVFTFPFILVAFFLYYFSNVSFSFNSVYCFDVYLFDEMSLFLVYMTLFVLYVSYIYSLNTISLNLNLTFMFMLLFCLFVFFSNNLLVLYLSYEASLIPILFIIINWGSYPERSLSALMLLVYTSVFTFPFIYVLFVIYELNLTFMFNAFYYFDISPLLSFLVFLTFAVKLPIYGLHFWLPIAHVEAPTFGSIILAGVLLKLGGLGLVRLLPFLGVLSLKTFILSYLLVFIICVTFICCFQSDFNRLVAYSSVSHMMAIPIIILSNNLLSTKCITMLIFLHGLSSPILFILVGVLYSMFATRQLVGLRGVVLISPLLSFVVVLAFFFTLSAPPFPSFVSEVFFVISSIYLSKFTIVVFLIFCFVSLIYNLNWLSSVLFSSSTEVKSSSCHLTYNFFMPLFLSLLLCIPFSIIVFFV